MAQEVGGVWLRIDSIEQAIRASGGENVGDEGYRVAYAVAEDNLRLGRIVIGDSVNAWGLTRDAWRDVGRRAEARLLEVEVICSDIDAHRRRIETRAGEIPRLKLPDWEATMQREYHVWTRDHLTVDTAFRSVEDCVAEIRSRI